MYQGACGRKPASGLPCHARWLLGWPRRRHVSLRRSQNHSRRRRGALHVGLCYNAAWGLPWHAGWLPDADLRHSQEHFRRRRRGALQAGMCHREMPIRALAVVDPPRGINAAGQATHGHPAKAIWTLAVVEPSRGINASGQATLGQRHLFQLLQQLQLLLPVLLLRPLKRRRQALVGDVLLGGPGVPRRLPELFAAAPLGCEHAVYHLR